MRNDEGLGESAAGAATMSEPEAVLARDVDAEGVERSMRPPPNEAQPVALTNESIEPLADRVLIRPIAEADMKGGLYIPEAAKEKPVRGVVLAVGPGKVFTAEEGGPYRNVPMFLRVGDIVVYGKYSGIEVQLNGATVLLIREQDVMGRVQVGGVDAPDAQF